MEIKKITVSNEGYIHCRSNFYYAQDGLDKNRIFEFSSGTNFLIGEIDSSNWAISYLLSMYLHRPKDFILFEPPKVILNDQEFSLDELAAYSCYMDKLYPLFSTDNSVHQLVSIGLKKTQRAVSSEEIRELFHIDKYRFEKPIQGVGNEVFRAMAAIGYSEGKQLFCFPWMSDSRFKAYHNHMPDLLEVLDVLNTTTIIPIGRQETKGRLRYHHKARRRTTQGTVLGVDKLGDKATALLSPRQNKEK